MSSRLPALAAVVLLASACAGQADGAPPAATAACDAVEQPAVQGGQHLLAGQEPPIPYSSTPPSSGWHASGAFAIAVQPADDPLTEPEQVSVLEAGGVVVSYADDLPADQVEALAAHVRDAYDGRVAVTAYDALEEASVAFSGWGVVQRCDALDLEALDAFVTAYADEEPSVPGDH